MLLHINTTHLTFVIKYILDVWTKNSIFQNNIVCTRNSVFKLDFLTKHNLSVSICSSSIMTLCFQRKPFRDLVKLPTWNIVLRFSHDKFPILFKPRFDSGVRKPNITPTVFLQWTKYRIITSWSTTNVYRGTTSVFRRSKYTFKYTFQL